MNETRAGALLSVTSKDLYTYIKTMFELNKHYGWSKFIVVVPSIAIREGVYVLPTPVFILIVRL